MIWQGRFCSKQGEQETVNSIHEAWLGIAPAPWLSSCISTVLSPIIFAACEKGEREEKSEGRTWEAVFLSCGFKCLMEGLWVEQLGGHGSQHPEWLPHSRQQVVTSPLFLRAGGPQPDTGSRPIRNWATRQGVSSRQVIEASSVFTAVPCHLRFHLSSIHLLSDRRQHYVLIGVWTLVLLNHPQNIPSSPVMEKLSSMKFWLGTTALDSSTTTQQHPTCPRHNKWTLSQSFWPDGGVGLNEQRRRGRLRCLPRYHSIAWKSADASRSQGTFDMQKRASTSITFASSSLRAFHSLFYLILTTTL